MMYTDSPHLVYIRLTYAIKVSFPVGSKTLVLRFEQIIRNIGGLEWNVDGSMAVIRTIHLKGTCSDHDTVNFVLSLGAMDGIRKLKALVFEKSHDLYVWKWMRIQHVILVNFCSYGWMAYSIDPMELRKGYAPYK